MRFLKFAVLFSALFLIPSCGEEEESTDNNGFEFSVDSQAILLPVGESASTRDCNFKTYTGNRFSLGNIRMSWNKFDRDLTLIYIKVDISSPNVSYTKTLAADDFQNFFYFDDEANVIQANGLVPAPLQGETRIIGMRTVCRMIFEGVPIENEEANFEAVAQVTLQAIAVGNEAGVEAGTVELGDEISIRSRTTFRLVFNNN